jgi:serine/threonine protein kinase
VTLFYFLTGQYPFDASSCDELYEKICKGKYTLPKSMSEGAQSLLSKMLLKDPKLRISASEAL